MAFGWELTMTFLLVAVVYAVAIGKPSFNETGPLAVGFTLWASASVGQLPLLSDALLSDALLSDPLLTDALLSDALLSGALFRLKLFIATVLSTLVTWLIPQDRCKQLPRK